MPQLPPLPILTMPYEIISEIFLHCLPPDGRVRPYGRRAPLLISQICRQWRAIAISVPRLWASIALVSITPPHYAQAAGLRHPTCLARLWFARAKHCPLSITIYQAGAERLPDGLVDLLISYSAQWGRLELCISMDDLQELSRAEGPFPSLTTLALDTEVIWKGPLIPFIHAPSIRILRLSVSFASYFRHHFAPQPSHPSIIALEICSANGDDALGDPTDPRLINGFPHLLHLTLTERNSEDGEGGYLMPDTTPRHHELLHSLTLSELIFLDRVTLPSLSDLIVYLSDCSALVTTLSAFVLRSGCSLKRFSLRISLRNAPEVRDALAHVPTVHTLFLDLTSASVNEDISALAFLEDHDILPRLTHLRIHTQRHPRMWNVCLAIVQARCGRGLICAEFKQGLQFMFSPPTQTQLADFEAVASQTDTRIVLYASRITSYSKQPLRWIFPQLRWHLPVNKDEERWNTIPDYDVFKDLLSSSAGCLVGWDIHRMD